MCLGRTSSGRGRRCLSPSADSRKAQASAANSPSVELPEFERLDREKSPLFTPLVDGSMASASAMVPLVKVEKKIAQISRVIQHLNAKSDDSDLDSLAGGRVERGGASVAATGQPRQLFARQASAGELPRIHCRLLQALHQPLLTPQRRAPAAPESQPAEVCATCAICATLLSTQAGNYENEIEGILRDASERVRRFHAACQHKHDSALLEARAEEIQARYEAQRVRALKEIEAFKKRTGAQQARFRPPDRPWP